MRGKATIAGVLLVTFVMAAVSPAQAALPHTVVAGDTLWSIAAASNFTTRSVAAYNGLSPDARVVIGSTVLIPSEYEAARSPGGGAPPAPVAVTRPQPTAQRTPVRPCPHRSRQTNEMSRNATIVTRWTT